MKKKDLNVDIKRNEIPKRFYKGSEIFKVKLMDIREASAKIEWGQIKVLQYLLRKF
jgi:hypothetical protein